MGKDIYPQFMRMPRVTEAVAGTFIQSPSIPTPVQLEDNIVMELLWVDLELDGGGAQANADDVSFELEAQITHQTQAALLGYDNGALIAKFKETIQLIWAEATETGGQSIVYKGTFREELANKDGRGVLFAGKQLFLGVRGSSGVAALATSCRIAYRLVKLPQTEAIGLIQSWS